MNEWPRNGDGYVQIQAYMYAFTHDARSSNRMQAETHAGNDRLTVSIDAIQAIKDCHLNMPQLFN